MCIRDRYRITHNNTRGYRQTLDEAFAAEKERLGPGKHLMLASYCDVNAQNHERFVSVYYTPSADRYDMFAIEGFEQRK